MLSLIPSPHLQVFSHLFYGLLASTHPSTSQVLASLNSFPQVPLPTPISLLLFTLNLLCVRSFHTSVHLYTNPGVIILISEKRKPKFSVQFQDLKREPLFFILSMNIC